MKRILLTFIFVMFFNVQAYALELLMLHNKHCGYCIAFMKEVAVDYEYRDMPLVIIDAYNQPDWFKEAYKENRIKPIRGTPTFIIWNGRKELGRLVGYSGKEWFYTNLDSIFKK
jgi:thioredoxin-related protein